MTAPAIHSRRPSGFTLIELLTVIAIIAVLAGLTVGGTAAAKHMRINSRGQADLHRLLAAIESYKADRNAYPPDHLLAAGSPNKTDPTINPLFYELRGMEVVNGTFRVKGSADTIAPAAVRDVFGRRGFLNASAEAAEPARTYFDPKASEVYRHKVGGQEVDLLVTAFPWPRNAIEAPPLAGTFANPWRYVSTSPTNNSGGFDLWAEVVTGREKDPKTGQPRDAKRLFKNW